MAVQLALSSILSTRSIHRTSTSCFTASKKRKISSFQSPIFWSLMLSSLLKLGGIHTLPPLNEPSIYKALLTPGSNTILTSGTRSKQQKQQSDGPLQRSQSSQSSHHYIFRMEGSPLTTGTLLIIISEY